jgi:hypothetical protein
MPPSARPTYAHTTRESRVVSKLSRPRSCRGQGAVKSLALATCTAHVMTGVPRGRPMPPAVHPTCARTTSGISRAASLSSGPRSCRAQGAVKSLALATCMAHAMTGVPSGRPMPPAVRPTCVRTARRKSHAATCEFVLGNKELSGPRSCQELGAGDVHGARNDGRAGRTAYASGGTPDARAGETAAPRRTYDLGPREPSTCYFTACPAAPTTCGSEATAPAAHERSSPPRRACISCSVLVDVAAGPRAREAQNGEGEVENMRGRATRIPTRRRSPVGAPRQRTTRSTHGSTPT